MQSVMPAPGAPTIVPAPVSHDADAQAQHHGDPEWDKQRYKHGLPHDAGRTPSDYRVIGLRQRATSATLGKAASFGRVTSAAGPAHSLTRVFTDKKRAFGPRSAGFA